MLLSTDSQSSEKISGEAVWKKQEFFFEERADFSFEKRNFPESTLCSVNQGYISPVKGGELAIYTHVFLLEQLNIAANRPADIETYESKKNETKLIRSMYDQTTGDFLGLWKELAYIVLHGDVMECFFSYGYNEKKSKVLYSAAKDRISNAVIATTFKKHFYEFLNERRHNKESSTLFYFLPLITNQKVKINQHRDNVNLNPIDCSLGYLNSFCPDKEVSFRPDF